MAEPARDPEILAGNRVRAAQDGVLPHLGTLDVRDQLGSALAHRSLEQLAREVARKVATSVDGVGVRMILVTSDLDLAVSDTSYHDVTAGLRQLTALADQLVERTDPDAEGIRAYPAVHELSLFAGEPRRGLAAGVLAGAAAGGPLGVAGAVAAAVPAALSFLSAHRSVSTSAVTPDDIAAAAAVCGALLDVEVAKGVLHDDFRLLPSGGLRDQVDELTDVRQELVAQKLTLDHDRSIDESELAGLRERSEAPADDPDLRRRCEVLRREIDEAAVRLGLVDSVLTMMDGFIQAVTAVAPDAKLSPLSAAALRQQLHSSMDPAGGTRPAEVSHVLLVKGSSGSSRPVHEDRAPWFDDEFSTAASTSLTYMLMDTHDSSIVSSGTVVSG